MIIRKTSMLLVPLTLMKYTPAGSISTCSALFVVPLPSARITQLPAALYTDMPAIASGDSMYTT